LPHLGWQAQQRGMGGSDAQYDLRHRCSPGVSPVDQASILQPKVYAAQAISYEERDRAAERGEPMITRTKLVTAEELELVPDIVVEVASPGDRRATIRRKTQQWLAAGVRVVWNVYPRTRTIVVSRPDQPDAILHAGDVLTGEPVLPEFSVPVVAIFA